MGVGFNEGVQAQAVAGDGTIFVGGRFTTADGVQSAGLARVSEDRAVDPVFGSALGAGYNNFVRSIAVRPDGSLVVGGQYTTVSGTPANRISIVSQTGVVDQVFAQAAGAGFNNTVNSVVALGDGSFLAGGYFTEFNGTGVNGVARILPDGQLDATFAANLGDGFNGVVRSIDVDAEGNIFVGGEFTSVNGILASRIARLATDGTPDEAFAAAIGTGFVSVLPNGDLAVGGQFSTFNGVPTGRVAVLNRDGDPDLNSSRGWGPERIVSFVSCSARKTEGSWSAERSTPSTEHRRPVSRG